MLLICSWCCWYEHSDVTSCFLAVAKSDKPDCAGWLPLRVTSSQLFTASPPKVGLCSGGGQNGAAMGYGGGRISTGKGAGSAAVASAESKPWPFPGSIWPAICSFALFLWRPKLPCGMQQDAGHSKRITTWGVTVDWAAQNIHIHQIELGCCSRGTCLFTPQYKKW